MTDGVEVAAIPASSLAVPGESSLTPYWRFQGSVARAQLAAWLPAPGRLLIDISGPASHGAVLAAARGHTVVRILPAYPGSSGTRVPGGSGQNPAADWPGHNSPETSGNAPPRLPEHHARTRTRNPGTWVGGLGIAAARADHAGPGAGRFATGQAGAQPGRVVPVVAEPGGLSFLADGCADGVIAEDGALSHHLMSEDLAAEITRVLRPGGELLACVDSLVLGMAIMAEQHHWAHLTDLPHSEVVLIPWPDGTITRCFGVGQLQDLLTEAGLEVSWITPRTVLSPSMVDHVLRQDPKAMARLVRAELRAERDRRPHVAGSDESFGINLLAAARKPAGGGASPARHWRMTAIAKRSRRRTVARTANGPESQPRPIPSTHRHS